MLLPLITGPPSSVNRFGETDLGVVLSWNFPFVCEAVRTNRREKVWGAQHENKKVYIRMMICYDSKVENLWKLASEGDTVWWPKRVLT
jgi:hypothetical protein